MNSAIKFFVSTLFCIGAFNTNAQSTMNMSNIQKGVDAFVKKYKQNGIAGASGEVASCYVEVDKLKSQSVQKYSKFEFCVSMDLAAYRWDTDISKRNNFPPSDFFKLENISNRVESRVSDWTFKDDRVRELANYVNQYVYISFQK